MSDRQVEQVLTVSDIDECVDSGESPCDSNQDCKNIQGGFQCVCKTGFQLDPLLQACVGKVFISIYYVRERHIFGKPAIKLVKRNTNSQHRIITQCQKNCVLVMYVPSDNFSVDQILSQQLVEG
jgi:hypothetical protein